MCMRDETNYETETMSLSRYFIGTSFTFSPLHGSGRNYIRESLTSY